MPEGLEVYGPDGSQFISVTDRYARFLGSTQTSNNGFIDDSRISQGWPFYVVLDIMGSRGEILPNVYFSGNRLNWEYPTTNPNPSPPYQNNPNLVLRAPVIIQYGVF